MKMMLTLLMTLITINANALTIAPIFSAELVQPESWNVDQDLGSIYNGNIYVDLFNQTLGLDYDYQMSCDDGMACIQALSERSIILPIISQKTEPCGSITYIAERNMMPADGTREVLEITSFSHNICMHLPVNKKTEVTYTIEWYSWVDGRVVSLQAELLADQF